MTDTSPLMKPVQNPPPNTDGPVGLYSSLGLYISVQNSATYHIRAEIFRTSRRLRFSADVERSSRPRGFTPPAMKHPQFFVGAVRVKPTEFFPSSIRRPEPVV
ncbi:hypothetical protein PGTUg99_012628 [Puccinia graminis f. sp. tritici]|uniref:Uncharacterized protein n=1 Tax=Puccinia graminis f. sp. tritici TaxID=56615 RepID=A0A5B0MAK2_PUCGR|nr:hypothetical protein PGTUg99_012628 [Puccinia graminis f. sp. tritici]